MATTNNITDNALKNQENERVSEFSDISDFKMYNEHADRMFSELLRIDDFIRSKNLTKHDNEKIKVNYAKIIRILNDIPKKEFVSRCQPVVGESINMDNCADPISKVTECILEMMELLIDGGIDFEEIDKYFLDKERSKYPQPQALFGIDHNIRFPDIQESVMNCITPILNKLASLYEDNGFMGMYLLGLAAIYFTSDCNDYIKTIIAILALLNSFYVGFAISKQYIIQPVNELQDALQLMNRIDEGYFSASDEDDFPVAQSGIENIESFSNVFVLILSGMTGLKPRDPLNSAISTVLRTSGKLVNEGIVKAISAASNLVSLLIESVSGKNKFSEFFQIEHTTDPEILQFINSSDIFRAKYSAGILCQDTTLIDTVSLLITRAEGLLTTVPKDAGIRVTILEAHKALLRARFEIMADNSSLSGTRVEPVSVYFYGDPGIKKTILSETFSKILLMYLVPDPLYAEAEQNPNKFIFAAPTDKYWDCYTLNAIITVIDDGFQKRDSVGDEDSMALKYIDMINTATYNLRMAAVEKKGNNFFRSAAVVGTGNPGTLENVVSIHSKEALLRRMHFMVGVTINEKYIDTPITNENDPAKIPTDFWTLNVYEHRSNKKIYRGTMDILQLAKLAAIRYQHHIVHYKLNKTMVAETLRSCANDIREFRNSGFSRANTLPIDYDSDSDSDVEEDIEMDHIESQSGFFKNFFTPTTSSEDLPGGFKLVSSRLDKLNSDVYDVLLNSFMLHCVKLREGNHIANMDIARESLRKYCKYNGKTYDDILSHIQSNIVMYEGYDTWELVEETAIIFTECSNAEYDKGIDPFTGKKRWVFYSSKTVWATIKSLFKKIYNRVKQFLQDYGGTIIFLTTVGGGFIYAAYKLVKAFSGDFTASFSDIVPHSVDTEKMAARFRKTPGKKPNKEISRSLMKLSPGMRIEPQGHFLPTGTVMSYPKFTVSELAMTNSPGNVVCKILNKLFYLIHIRDNFDNSSQFIGHATNVQGQFFIFNFHYVFCLKDKYDNNPGDGRFTATLVSAGSNCRLAITMEYLLSIWKATDESSDRDLCLVKIPSAQKNSAGALKYFLKDDDVKALQRAGTFQATMLSSKMVSENHRSTIVHSFHAKFEKANEKYIAASWGDELSFYTLKNLFTYGGKFQRGDCGSLVFTNSASYENRCIIGIHCAGQTSASEGYGSVITQEVLQALLIEGAEEESYIFSSEESVDGISYCDLIVPQAGFYPTYSVDPKFIPNETVKSSIRRSKLYGVFKEQLGSEYLEMEKAHLRPYIKEGICYDPFEIALSKYCVDPPPCIPEVIQQAKSSYQACFMNFHRVGYAPIKRTLTLKEALHGIGALATITSKTSPGWPMNTLTIKNVKKYYYESVYKNHFVDIETAYAEIESEINRYLDMYKNDIRPFFVFVDNLKDQRIKIGKDNRLFSAAAFYYLVLNRMFFGGFMEYMTTAGIYVGSAIGMNPYSDSWDVLARKMSEFDEIDPQVGAGDYSRFDCSISPELLNACLDIIQDYYGYEDKFSTKVRAMLFAEVTNPKHLYKGEIFEWYYSMTSGSPLTALLNTMNNNLLFRSAWIILGLAIKVFNTHVSLIALGDDVLYTVHSDFRPFFNEMTLPRALERMGMTYTTETKEAATSEFRDLTSVEFLKRGFRFERALGSRGMWVAPLRFSAMMDILCWTKDIKGQQDLIAVTNAELVIRELALHGRTKFDTWCLRIYNKVKELYPYQDLTIVDTKWYSVLQEVTSITDFEY